ncbi:MAG: cytochrome c [Chloroflexota bacterium]
MDDYSAAKGCLGAMLGIGLFVIVGAAVIFYIIMAANGYLPPSGQKNVAGVATPELTPLDGSESVAALSPQSSSDSQMTTALVSASSPDLKEAAAPPAQSADEGKAIFETQCVACHTIGGGTLVGPDLQGVTTRRDQAWLARWILEPDKVLAEGDPIATELFEQFNNVPMINQGLIEAQVAAVIAYLETQTGATATEETAALQPTAAPVITLPPGNPAAGRAIFTGAIPSQNGGPACISCHSVSGIGALGGGSLGPDLTNVYARYGEAGLASALKGLPFPTMQGVFGNKPLTNQEAAHLYAYFVQVDRTEPKPLDMTVLFVAIGLSVSLVLGFLGHLTWRRRLTEVRRPMLKGAS